MDATEIYSQVSKRYSAASKGVSDTYGRSVATAFGYSEDELASIPKDANLGLSCGNPTAIASIREGETVIDLGSGAGFDAFLVSSKVAASGRVIGVDMNKEMLARANRIKKEAGKTNVEFVESQITSIPLESNVADCIISNCVINLVPEKEKQLAFSEMHRLLRPGGRLAISDILAKRPLPDKLRENMALYVGCIAGASQVSAYEKYLEVAGFEEVIITDTGSNLNVYADTKDGCCGSDSVGYALPKNGEVGGGKNSWLPQLAAIDLNEWAGSYMIYTVKK